MPKRSVVDDDAHRDAAAGASAASSGAVYLIQDVARIAGVSPTTVRVWERNGLISSHRGSNGYRYFSESDLQRLRHIAHLRKVEGLNTEGIRRALAGGNDSGTSGPRASAAEGKQESLGPRLRKLRKDAGMTLGQAAEKSGLSSSFLSALERDQTGVSSESLHSLAHAYGSTFSALMRGETSEVVQLSTEGKRSSTTMHGTVVESLISGQTMLDAAVISLEPGADPGAYTHDGEEIIVVLAGELDVRLASGQRYHLRPGESLFYPSTIEHRWINSSATTTRFLWVATPPTY